jgi:glycosyltransferase involved in cell wall biosynthesis
MRIAILSPVWFPVPPTRYGGIEWIVSLLAEGLVGAGHEVTLFASGDSSTEAELVSIFDEAPSEMIGITQFELRHALSCFERAGDFDVINDHSGPLGVVLGGVVTPRSSIRCTGRSAVSPGSCTRRWARSAPRSA